MQKFTTLKSIPAYLPIVNIDTDMIIPKQFLKTIKRSGLGKGLFYEMRFDEKGSEIKDFILNKEPYNRSKILVSLENFGCGSSREHAPWALVDFGIKVVLAKSFADIFYNNCFKNGILPVILPQKQVDVLMSEAEKGANAVIEVDLESQNIVTSEGEVFTFEIDPFKKHCLINGLDDIGLTMEKEDYITAFESKASHLFPWA